ncbi:hypothetical protein BC939DRAFT_473977 [Gamsiella multidivaricata]|uniref:uncharacterized protein n=1 Tax=Gamsiella multidivaricata TaxID=101098 RepID=UPI00221EE0FD|nr:uncharacterized protein BC939DRAFT_473977 [Gamsiella multidivaricata]KAG0361811.1 hypothetical protein BGZ54_008935 [Gamsiella multidivaricata]KAI7829778.1 hypothetical protein BC939DRAFT_473977 [Gamsiella multidivaricata]
MRFTAIAALLLAAVASAQSSSFSKCVIYPNNTAYPTELTVTSLSLNPDPPCIGQNYCINVTGTLSTPIINGAKLAISGRYGGRVIYTDNQDLCTVLAASGHPCPVPITTTSLSLCVLMMTYTPPIPRNMTIEVTNGNGNRLFCQATMNLVPKKCT